MANKRYMKNRPIRLFEQMITLRAAYPTATCEIHNNTLWWFGKVRPTPLSKEYEVVMTFTLWHSPSVWIFGDNLENLDDPDFPHKYHIDSKSKLVKYVFIDIGNFLRINFCRKLLFHGL